MFSRIDTAHSSRTWIEQRRACFEAMGHAGDIDLHHKVIGQVSVDVGAPGYEALDLVEIGIEKLERGAPQQLSHRPGVAILFVLIGKRSQGLRVAPARMLSRSAQNPADPRDFELAL